MEIADGGEVVGQEGRRSGGTGYFVSMYILTYLQPVQVLYQVT